MALLEGRGKESSEYQGPKKTSSHCVFVACASNKGHADENMIRVP